jgi:DUF4097 and DUF4098 domain-containing protein YvlB
MLKRIANSVGTSVLVLCMASVALAQQNRVYREGSNWGQEVNGSLNGAKNLRVRVAFGAVRIQGGSQQGIDYNFRSLAYTSSEDKARREFNSYKLNAYVRGDTAYIIADEEGSRPRKCSGELVINTPRDMASVKIETDGGNIVVNSISGQLGAETGGGSIKVDDIGGSVTAETGGDSIDVGTVGGDVNLQTGGGRINIRSVKGKINASTGGGEVIIQSGGQSAVLEAGGGNIQVKQLGGKLRVSTGGGNIELGDIGGPVELETGGGSIRVASAKGLVRAETGAGRIELNGVSSARVETGAGGILAKFISGDDRSDSALETSAGDITVYLSPGLAISVRASIDMANGHTIHSDFSDIRVSSTGEWPESGTATAEGKLNGGGPVLKLRTSTGDINILRASR